MTDKDKKAYERNRKQLDYIINHKEMTMVRRDVLKKAFILIIDDMDVVADDAKTCEPTGEEKSTVKEALNMIMTAVINQPMRPILKDLAREFGLLAFNWNQAVGKRPDITDVIVNTKHIVAGVLSLTEAIQVMKIMIQKCGALSKFTPPAFELSKAYLKTLDEEVEKDA